VEDTDNRASYRAIANRDVPANACALAIVGLPAFSVRPAHDPLPSIPMGPINNMLVKIKIKKGSVDGQTKGHKDHQRWGDQGEAGKMGNSFDSTSSLVFLRIGH